MRFDLGRMNKAKKELGESPTVLPTTEYEEPIIVNDRLVDKNDIHKVIGTKGDMYTKKIMHKILQEGCLDHNPRPKYHDDYPNAEYKRYIVTKNGERIELNDNQLVEVGKNSIRVADITNHKYKTTTVFVDYPKAKYERCVKIEEGEITLSPLDEIEEHDGFIRIKVPAHTLSVNEGVECTYDLSKGESPMTTLRPIAVKSSFAEILWIYQLKSNDLVEFDQLLDKCTWDENGEINNWWEEWALRDENGNYILNEKGHPIIGNCYGKSVDLRDMLFREVINPIKKNPDGRRHICCIWQVDDFDKPHGLKPCAFLTIWNVRHGWDGKDYLDMTMVQRSSDFATAGCINQVQYVALQKMVAAELGITPGYFTWKPVNIQLYDRHIEQAIEMLNREPVDCEATIELVDDKVRFNDETKENVEVRDYPKELIRKKNPQLKFQLGV
ncbi:MAG: thymidylate synthase [Bacilli bacterium]|nr:thymidylate synthase [Bacilli bacterium]